MTPKMARMVGDESGVLSLSVIKLYKVQVVLKKVIQNKPIVD